MSCEEKLVQVQVTICRPCLDGIGDMCDTPGCFLIRHDVLNGWDPLEYQELLTTLRDEIARLEVEMAARTNTIGKAGMKP